jgi:hypothetical protein
LSDKGDFSAQAFRRTIARRATLVSWLQMVVIPLCVALWTALYGDGLKGVVFWAGASVLVAATALLFWATYGDAQNMPQALVKLDAMERQLSEAALAAHASMVEKRRAAAQGIVAQLWIQLLHQFMHEADGKREKRLDALLDPLQDFGDDLFGFTFKDLWSISVFLHDPASKTLSPIFRRRHSRHPSCSHSGIGRSLKDNSGHAGFAFQLGKPVVSRNANLQPEKKLMTPPSELRDYDSRAYISFISVPFRTDKGQGGVLVVSSDQESRFDDQERGVVEHAALCVALAISSTS